MSKGNEFENQYRVGQVLPSHAVAMRKHALTALELSTKRTAAKVHQLNPKRLYTQTRELSEAIGAEVTLALNRVLQ